MSMKFTVDEQIKIIKIFVDGNPNIEETIKFKDEYLAYVSKIKQNDYSLVNRTSSVSVFAPEVMEVLKVMQKNMENFKKVATIVSSVLFETQMKKSTNDTGFGANRRFFKSEEEAIKWLVE